MKKALYLSLLVLWVLLSIVGCSLKNEKVSHHEEQIREVIAEKQEGDFILRVISKKNIYQPYEQVKIYAMLKYVGEKPKEVIYHAASPFWFNIEEHTRNITINAIQPLPRISKILQKD